ncbi:MAG: YdcH family protein [Bacteroidota bacterium]
MIDDNIEEIRRKLAELTTEHRDLDDVIDRMAVDPFMDQLRLQRLKKRKLMLKDQIANLENQMIPDIIA